MKIERREFLGRALAGTGGLLLGGGLAEAKAAASPADPFALVPFGRTKLKVSRVGFGTGMKGWLRQSNQTRLGREAFERLLRTAYDKGVRLFDMADLYGTHPYLARALRGIPRDAYTISTKIWWRPNGLPERERPGADRIVARFLEELATDYIDVVQLHCVTAPTWPRDLREPMEILDGLKRKGVIRAHGVSCHSVEALRAAAKEPWVDVVHSRVNPYGVKMDRPPSEVPPALKAIHDAGKAVIGMKLIGEGAFRDSPEKRDRSVRYVLGLGSVDAMIVGFERPEEIDDFAARVRSALRARADAKA